MEEDNLFKIHLVQEDEQALEKQKKASEETILKKQEEINEVQKNIEMLMNSKKILHTKH